MMLKKYQTKKLAIIRPIHPTWQICTIKTIKILTKTTNSPIIFYSKQWQNAFFEIVFRFVLSLHCVPNTVQCSHKQFKQIYIMCTNIEWLQVFEMVFFSSIENSTD